MAERFIDTGFWNSPEVEPLSADARYFLLYSRTNVHVNQAGLYVITWKVMREETQLDDRRLQRSIDELRPEVIWYPERSLLWSRSFLAINTRSPKFLTAAARCLKPIPRELVSEFIRYNAVAHNLQVPYSYPTDTLSIPSAQETDQKESVSGSVSRSVSGYEGERGYGGEGEIDVGLAKMATAFAQNCGEKKLTEAARERLIWIRDQYPVEWFMAALTEAVRHEKRSLAYIEAILENWKKNGFKSPPPKNGQPKKTAARGRKQEVEGLSLDE